jgi:hypothetical protein
VKHALDCPLHLFCACRFPIFITRRQIQRNRRREAERSVPVELARLEAGTFDRAGDLKRIESGHSSIALNDRRNGLRETGKRATKRELCVQ